MFVCWGAWGAMGPFPHWRTEGLEDWRTPPRREGWGALCCASRGRSRPCRSIPKMAAAAAATGSVPVRVCHQEIVKFDLEIKAAVQVAPPAEPP